MLRMAFLAFSSLFEMPMLPEVSSRNAKETGALWSRSNVSNGTVASPTRITKSPLASPSTNLPCLSVTRTGSITYSAPALSVKEGASDSGAGAWDRTGTAAARSRAARKSRFT